MQKSIVLTVIITILCGLAIGTQSSINSATGKITGATLTGLLVNFLGGKVAGMILLGIYLRQGVAAFSYIRGTTLVLLFAAGLLGIGIIIGIAYALPKIGVAAGLSAIIAGQMAVALVVDAFGLAGGVRIPLSWMRITGIGLMALGTWTLLFKK